MDNSNLNHTLCKLNIMDKLNNTLFNINVMDNFNHTLSNLNLGLGVTVRG